MPILRFLAAIGFSQFAFFFLWLWLLSRWEERGLPAAALGLAGGLPWAVCCVALWAAPGACRRLGSRGTTALALALHFAAAVLAAYEHPGTELAAWILAGFGLGLRWVGLDSWMVSTVERTHVGRLLGAAETIAGVAMLTGPSVVTVVSGPSSVLLAMAAPLLAAACLPWSQPERPEHRTTLGKGMDGSGLVLFLAAAFLGGSLESGFMGAAAPLLAGSDDAADRMLWIAIGVAAGSLAAQYPFGLAADRLGIFRPMGLAAILSAFALAWAALDPNAILWAGMLLGACGGALFTLASTGAVRGSTAPAARIAAAAFAYTFGSFVSPAVTGFAVKWWGASPALLLWTGLCVGLCCWVLFRKPQNQTASSLR